MSDKRQQIADETRALLQQLLDSEQAGVEITQVQLQRVEPPLAVIDAFNDVQRARADQERARNEAEAYANDILPRARGEAEHTRQDAEAYHASVVTLAAGRSEGVSRRARRLSDRARRHLVAPLYGSDRRSLEEVDARRRRHFRQRGSRAWCPDLSLPDPRARPPAPPQLIESARPTTGAVK